MCRWFQFRKDYLGICPSQFIYPLYFLKVPPTGKHLRVILLERVIWTMCVLSLFQLRALSCFSHCEVKNKELICSLLLKVYFAKARRSVYSHGKMGTLCEMSIFLPKEMCRIY